MGFLLSVISGKCFLPHVGVFFLRRSGAIVKKRERWYTIKLISYRYENGVDSFGK